MAIENFKIVNMYGGTLYLMQVALASEESKEYERYSENWYKYADSSSDDVESLQNYINAAFVSVFSSGWDIEETAEEVAETLTATLKSMTQELTIGTNNVIRSTIKIGIENFIENQSVEGEYEAEDVMYEYIGPAIPLWEILNMEDES